METGRDHPVIESAHDSPRFLACDRSFHCQPELRADPFLEQPARRFRDAKYLALEGARDSREGTDGDQDAIGIHHGPVFDDLVVADTKDVGGGRLHAVAGRGDAGVVTHVRTGHDRPQADEIAFDEDAHILVHVKSQIRERLPEFRVGALDPSPTAGPVYVVREERSCHGLVDAALVTGIDGVEESPHQTVGTFGRSRGMEAFETRGRGGTHRITFPPSAVSVWPVSASASSRASMATTAAVSSGVSGRGSAWCACVSTNSAVERLALAGVGVSPGATAVTAIPLRPSPTASVRAIPISAPFDA